MSTHPPIQIAVFCATPREAEIAVQAIEAFRLNGELDAPDVHDALPEEPLAQWLKTALDIAPANPVKTRVLETLLASAQARWVPSAELASAVEDLCESKESARNRVGAAIRDLSWQVAQVVPNAVVSKASAAVDLLVARMRSSGQISYRLTADGRKAVEHYLELQRMLS